MAEALRLDDVTAGYGPRVALRGVSLTVAAGEVVGLAGPNGSGKTTVIRVASRALRPAAGRVTLAGRDPYAMPAREAARLAAVVPQEVAPAFEFTAAEVVGMGRTPYLPAFGGAGPEDQRRITDAMRAASVEHLAGRSLAELSGGEKQRVILAQALAQDAPVMLLDEPTTHLDLRHVVDALSRVRALARAGRAVLAVFHDLTLAGGFCDRLVVLDEGAVVADGDPAEVLTPSLVRAVFGVEADVRPHPESGAPTVTVSPAGVDGRTSARRR